MTDLPDNCLPPHAALSKLLRLARDGWPLDEQGRITEGLFAGMTPDEVMESRDRYRRMMPSD